jgi:poly(3-hydroxybutyrate) depolymerase
MATGTRTTGAGVQRLDSLFPGDSRLYRSYIYVPVRCVGTKRYPLVVLLHGSNGNGLLSINGDDGLFKRYADSLGYLLLAPTGATGNWDVNEPRSKDLPMIDAPIRVMLEHYAIDPNRIILMGGSAGSGGALYTGYVNGDVFSHVVGFEGWQPFAGARDFDNLRAHGKAKFLFAMSTREGELLGMPAFMQWMQSKGYSATYVGDHGTHAMTWERGTVGYDWLTREKVW